MPLNSYPCQHAHSKITVYEKDQAGVTNFILQPSQNPLDLYINTKFCMASNDGRVV